MMPEFYRMSKTVFSKTARFRLCGMHAAAWGPGGLVASQVWQRANFSSSAGRGTRRAGSSAEI